MKFNRPNAATIKDRIKRYSEINEYFQVTGFEKRTDIPSFFIFRLDELPKEKSISMPPHYRDFYQVSLILDPGEAQISIDDQGNDSLENTTYFLSPRHVFSWYRSVKTTGFILYFKSTFLTFFQGDLEKDFSFFDISDSNSVHLSHSKALELADDLDRLYREYYSPNTYRQQILQASLLAILYKLKDLQEKENRVPTNSNRTPDLVFRFKNLVSNFFITDKKVNDYALKLFTTPNNLNKLVKQSLGKSAKEVIDEKVIHEVKKQLIYSTKDIAEIAYDLGFEEPTHFSRFFKKHTDQSPRDYRNSLV